MCSAILPPIRSRTPSFSSPSTPPPSPARTYDPTTLPQLPQRVRTPSTASPSSSLATQRRRQIDLLLSAVPSVKIVDFNRSVFEIFVLLPTGVQVTLRITLPVVFPQDPPAIQVLPIGLQHPWFNAQQFIIGLDSLRQWSSTQSDLGKVALDVLHELNSNPPRPKTNTRLDESSSTRPPTNGRLGSNSRVESNSSSSRPNTNSSRPNTNTNSNASLGLRPSGVDGWQPVARPVSAISVPPIPASFPELESRTAAELEYLLRTESELDKFVMGQDCVLQLQKVADELSRGNERLEAMNSKLSEDTKRTQSSTNSLRDAHQAKLQELEISAARQQQILQRQSTSAVSTQLELAADVLDKESEKFAMEYVSGDSDTKSFLQQYLAMRKQYHSRMARKEWNSPPTSSQGRQ